MLRKTKEFADSIAAVDLVRDAPAGALAITEPRPVWDRDGAMIEGGLRLALVQRTGVPIDLKALVRWLARSVHELHQGAGFGEAAATDLAEVLLALVVAACTDGRLDLLENLLASAPPAQIASWFVLPGVGDPGDPYHVGDFTYAATDLARLQARWQRAGATDWAQQRRHYEGTVSIFRDRALAALIDPLVVRPTDGADDREGAELVEEYFGRVAAAEHELFVRDLDVAQRPFRAVGLGGFSSKLSGVADLFHGRVCIVTRENRRRGWVRPQFGAVELRRASPGVLRAGADEIRIALDLPDWSTRPMDHLIDRFAQYVVRARDDLQSDDSAGALLHLVFGLDFLLGGAKALTETLARRTALLSAQAVGRARADVEKFVATTYEARSSYAHRGGIHAAPELDTVSRLLDIALAVMGSALHARHRPWASQAAPPPRDEWLKRIDLAVQYEAVHMAPDRALVAELGLDRVHVERVGLCWVRLRKDADP